MQDKFVILKKKSDVVNVDWIDSRASFASRSAVSAATSASRAPSRSPSSACSLLSRSVVALAFSNNCLQRAIQQKYVLHNKRKRGDEAERILCKKPDIMMIRSKKQDAFFLVSKKKIVFWAPVSCGLALEFQLPRHQLFLLFLSLFDEDALPFLLELLGELLPSRVLIATLFDPGQDQ